MRGRRAGKWVSDLDQWLAARKRKGGISAPIPASRELAGVFEVNHTSIFRQLQKLEESGVLWRADNGRFHFAEARSLVEKPRPIACLFRKIENWSALYQEIMEGIAQASGEQGLGSLLWHEEALVRQADPGQPPAFASLERQAQSLNRFITKYGQEIGGIILDHVWQDEALAQLPERLREHSVLLCRPATNGIAAVFPDFQAAANLAITHLSAMGYQKIIAIRPFPHDPSVEYCLACLNAAIPTAEIKRADTPGSRARLIGVMAKSAIRTGLIFPEDNTALLFRQECFKAGLRCPEDIGIVSLQGTRAATQGHLSHIRTDYNQLGQNAVALSLKLPPRRDRTPPFFTQGTSTAPSPSHRR